MTTRANPFLMFTGRAEEALNLYAASLPDARIVALERTPDGSGVATARLAVGDLEIMAFDSPPVHDFDFTPSMSIFLTVGTPEVVDRTAGLMAEGGKVLMPAGEYPFAQRYAWIQDRFGVSWQISAA